LVTPKRILIFNFKFMGDLLIGTALFRSLRKTYPKAFIAVVVRKEYEEVLAGNFDINELIVFDRTRMRTLRGLAKLRLEWDFLKRLRQGHFDTCFSMHPGDRTCLWAWASGTKWRIGTSVQPLAFLLNLTVSVPEPHLDGRDYLDYYYALAEPLGLRPIVRKTIYVLTPEARKEAQRSFPQIFQDQGSATVGIHSGASAPARQWPGERFARLAEGLMAEEGARAVVFAGPGEEALAHEVFDQITGGNKTFVAAPTLGQLAACLEQCQLFIGNDTGPRHLAVALGVPTIALMGQKATKVWGIYSEEQKHWVVQKSVHCQPCEKAYCDDNICMTAIAVEEVATLARKVLSETFKPDRPGHAPA